MKPLSDVSAASGGLIDFKVIDQNREEIGTLRSLWVGRTTAEVEFLGVKTGWLLGSNHAVPAARAQVDEAERVVQVPYGKEQVKSAPSHDADAEITGEEESAIFIHYGIHPSGVVRDPTEASTGTRNPGAPARDRVEVAITEERLQIDKRLVKTGAVRLRKIVRVERVQIPVDLRREEVVVERGGPGASAGAETVLADGDSCEVVLHQEEAVVSKNVVVTGAVRARKTVVVERSAVSETLRKDDVEVDRRTVGVGSAERPASETVAADHPSSKGGRSAKGGQPRKKRRGRKGRR